MANDIDTKNNSLDNLQSDATYKDLVDRISKRYSEGQTKAFFAINESIIDTNWNIGKYIVEFEQDGQAKAKYGSQLLERLSTDLTRIHGRGFSRSVLNYMRQFYLRYPICETLSHKLSWSHYCELLKISDDLERSFYYQQNINENWSVRELRRQKGVEYLSFIKDAFDRWECSPHKEINLSLYITKTSLDMLETLDCRMSFEKKISKHASSPDTEFDTMVGFHPRAY
jgi:hypothetical protein